MRRLQRRQSSMFTCMATDAPRCQSYPILRYIDAQHAERAAACKRQGRTHTQLVLRSPPDSMLVLYRWQVTRSDIMDLRLLHARLRQQMLLPRQNH